MKQRYRPGAGPRYAAKAPKFSASLLAQQAKEEEPEIRDGYVLFWGSWPSNWWYSPFAIDRVGYNCVEQYMMAEKARLFGDEETRAKILAARWPRTQKDLGREVRGYDDKKWSAARYKVVLKGTIEKYKQNPKLLHLLLDTGSAKFVECSPEDDLWGIGLSQDSPHATTPSKWQGQNLLGKALTSARATLKRTGRRA